MTDIFGNQYRIDVYTVEYEFADNMYERSSLDYLLYKEPIKYVNLLLGGKLKKYHSVFLHFPGHFQHDISILPYISMVSAVRITR